MQLDLSMAKHLLTYDFGRKFQRIASCSAYASFFAQHGRGDLTGDDGSEGKTGGDLGHTSEGKSGAKGVGESQGPDGRPKTPKQSDGEIDKKSQELGGKPKQPARMRRGLQEGKGGGPPGDGSKGAPGPGDGPKGGRIPPDLESYVVTLSKTLALATFPKDCKKPKVMLFCAQNERSYCRTKATEGGMCAALAAQKGGVSAFCEEDKKVLAGPTICHEYFDSTVPDSICSPSCSRNDGSSRFSFSWNTSDGSQCNPQNDACDLGKAVLCNRKGPVSNKSSCSEGKCQEKYCLEYQFGVGVPAQTSDYRGSYYN